MITAHKKRGAVGWIWTSVRATRVLDDGPDYTTTARAVAHFFNAQINLIMCAHIQISDKAVGCYPNADAVYIPNYERFLTIEKLISQFLRLLISQFLSVFISHFLNAHFFKCRRLRSKCSKRKNSVWAITKSDPEQITAQQSARIVLYSLSTSEWADCKSVQCVNASRIVCTVFAASSALSPPFYLVQILKQSYAPFPRWSYEHLLIHWFAHYGCCL